ncbi:cytochrome c3 family protein [Celeribacter persicus]|uniref:Cytochrome c7-like protein n=1 Tax=Celeribacter persicus TaxID=1651082 RepID=A0A2T5H0F1_9RHOB|nr:cytochrome c3 family protein [Celeribacter persicus]PTQ65064.1 cytochrome c7-like protein [Celeribacter persicus]
MSFKRKFFFPILLGFSIAAKPSISVAQEQSQEPVRDIEEIVEDLELYVMPDAGPFRPDQIEIKNKLAIGEWARSGHALSTAEAFTHWDEEGEVPVACATCHSGAGFRAFYGLDGSDAGTVEAPVPTGGVVDCDTCHNPGLAAVEEVKFPSGLMHPIAPGEASCLTCHQGRASGLNISASVADMALDDTNVDLRFINPHYAVAASTWLGGYGGSGYHYDGKDYSGRFFHARPVATCVSCHDPHSLEVSQNTCMSCHENGEPDSIRLSRVSYDGSGNLDQGLRTDVSHNAERLMGFIQDYAETVAGTAILYDGHQYPYFFADANNDGQIDVNDGRSVAYNAWTPRLLKAAYNWKFVTTDKGAFAHNPHYVLELLYDSSEDLLTALGMDIMDTGMMR